MSKAPVRAPTLSPRALLQAGIGLLICALGLWLAHRDRYDVKTVMATAYGCNMPTDIYEARSGSPSGYVVLLHGLFANKKVMTFVAQEFSNQELRVFVPDLPGHGKTTTPFSPERADACTESFMKDLLAHKAIVPQRTLLVGHSLGAAIAARVGARFPVAGVIAISPAPMHPAPGVPPELLLFPTPPVLPKNSLVLSAQWEPSAIRQIAQDLVTQSPVSNLYEVIPHTYHVSVLFDATTFDVVRSWTSQVLGTNPTAPLPETHPALGCLLGILGLSLIAPPFLREMATTSAEMPDDSSAAPPFAKGLAIVVAIGLLSVTVLRFVVPLRFVRIYQGDYLASFLLLAGLAVLILHRKTLPEWRSFFTGATAAGVAAAFLLVLLFAGWFEITFYEAWPVPLRWLRFLVIFPAFLPWHLAEEVLLGAPASAPRVRASRMLRYFVFRAALWLALLVGTLYLHSAQLAYLLMAVYFVLFSLVQRLATDVIRVRTRRPAAAAIFGAILLAAFVLAILPVA